MKRTLWLSVALGLVVSAACTTSTEGSPTGAASAPPPPEHGGPHHDGRSFVAPCQDRLNGSVPGTVLSPQMGGAGRRDRAW